MARRRSVLRPSQVGSSSEALLSFDAQVYRSSHFGFHGVFLDEVRLRIGFIRSALCWGSVGGPRLCAGGRAAAVDDGRLRASHTAMGIP